ncbi:MAG: response regulator [Polyangiaceae bacterium]
MSSSIIIFVNANTAPAVVLVADDEPTMLELVVRHLRSLQEPMLEVIDANDGDEAWRLARERLPDLVVLDVMMPGMSGWAVCRKIRQEAALAHTGVLMLTGIGDRLNETTSPLFGADEYIDKPFDFAAFDEKLRAVLEKRARQRDAVRRPRSDGAGVAEESSGVSTRGGRDDEPGAGSRSTAAATHDSGDEASSRAKKNLRSSERRGLRNARSAKRRGSTSKRAEPKRSPTRGEREKEKKNMASKKRAAKGVKRAASGAKRTAAKSPTKAAKSPARGVKSAKRSSKVVGKVVKATKAAKAPKRAKAKKTAKKTAKK